MAIFEVLTHVGTWLQAAYDGYLRHAHFVHQWWEALWWISFGTLGVCAGFWHVGTPLPSFFASRPIVRGNCSKRTLIGSLVILEVFSIGFGYIVEAITIRQMVYAGALTVVLMTRPSMLIHRMKEE